jgi:DNA-directed RNA polymerase specialized sigma24 family protein
MPQPSLEAQDAARRLIAGEAAAFEVLVRIYSPGFRDHWWVRHYALDPEDFVQDLWLSCWTHIDLLRRPQDVDLWIHQSMRDVVDRTPGPQDPNRRARTFQPLSRSIPDLRAQRAMSTDLISMRVSIRKEMVKIPRRMTQVVEAMALMGYTNSEIQERTAYSANLIKKLFVCGMVQLTEACVGGNPPRRIG